MTLLLLFGTGAGGGIPLQSFEVKSIPSEESVGKPDLLGGAVDVAFTPKSIASEESVGKPNVFVFVELVLKSIPSAEHVGAPILSLPAAPIPPTRILVRVMDRDAPLVERALLEARAVGAGFQDVLSAPGTGRVVVQNDDAELVAVRYGDLLRFEIDGLARFLAIAERRRRVAVSRDEEVGEETELSGRGVLARWSRAVVYPELDPGAFPFADSRVFNFASPALDDSGWSTSTGTTIELYNRNPVGWPDPDALFLWDRPNDDAGTPVGDVYLRHVFTVAALVVADVWVDADDEYDLWLDGQPLLSDRFSPDTGGNADRARVTLSAGEHLLAVKGRNLNELKGGVIVTVLELDAAGTPTGTITNTSDPSSWKVLGYPPAAPGFTPGEVVRVLLEEAQARGALTGTTLGFSDETDSAGVPWPVAADLAFPVGATYLAVLEQLAETYVELRHSPSTYRLEAYLSRGEATDVAFVEAASILELVHEGGIA